ELQIPYITIINKADLLSEADWKKYEELKPMFMCAKEGLGVEELKEELLSKAHLANINNDDVMVTNIRHVEALEKTHESLDKVLMGIDSGMTSDFLAIDIRQGLHHLGEITGSVTTDDLLENIFSKFCIGK